LHGGVCPAAGLPQQCSSFASLLDNPPQLDLLTVPFQMLRWVKVADKAALNTFHSY